MEAFESNIAGTGTESSFCADEERAVSFVNECLSGGYDEEGIARWWQRPRTQLDGLTPQQAWAEDPIRVIELAATVAGPMAQS